MSDDLDPFRVGKPATNSNWRRLLLEGSTYVVDYAESGFGLERLPAATGKHATACLEAVGEGTS